MTTQLIMIAGLPATGKTTLAGNIAYQQRIPVFSPEALRDEILSERLRNAKPTWEDLYGTILRLADVQLALGVSVILESTFPDEKIRQQAADLAAQHNAQFHTIYTECSDRVLWRQRLLARVTRAAPMETFTGVNEVKRLEKTYAPWNPDTTLFIDSTADEDANLQAALEWLASG